MIEKFYHSIEAILQISSSEKVVLRLIYTFYFFGAFILISDILKEAVEIIVSYIKDRNTKARLKKSETRFDKHIRYLLEANLTKAHITVIHFKLICIGLFITFFSLTIRVLQPGVSLLFSIIISVMPYFILRVRLERVRGIASHEAELLINELLIKYRIKNHNIEEAIEEIMKIKRLNKTKPLLAKLLLKLRNTRKEQEIKEAIRIFSYSIGTNWAKMLGSNIYQASVSNVNITMSLEDMMIQLRKAREMWEEQKRNTAEPRRMLLCIPLIYGLFLYVSLKVLDVPLKDYLRNQFVSEQGVTFFTLIIIGFLISITLVLLLFSRKFDF